MIKILKKIIYRVRKGEIITTAYLLYYFTYLKLYDLRNNTDFCNSQVPDKFGADYREGSTGNFPVHPHAIKTLIVEAELLDSSKIIDVGHGSGLPLYTLYKMGFKNIFGIEHGLIPFNLSQKNLNNMASIQYGDAFEVDYTHYDVVLFCSPFRHEYAESFVNMLPDNIHTIITISHDISLEPVLLGNGYIEKYYYKHHIYSIFNGKVWKKR